MDTIKENSPKFIKVSPFVKNKKLTGTLAQGRLIWFLSSDKTLYSSNVRSGGVLMLEREKIACVLDLKDLACLARLGVITFKEIRDGTQKKKAADAKWDKERKVASLSNTAIGLGIPKREITKLLKKYDKNVIHKSHAVEP